MDSLSRMQQHYPLQLGADTHILRTICTPVKNITKEIKMLATALKELVWTYEGVGLAAPQIAQSVRMAAITQRDMSGKKRKLTHEFVMINPEILASSDATCIEEEACLSLPGQKGDVSRPEHITVRYMTIDGKIHIHKATGYNARIILHEMDHLDGILFIDKLV